MKILNSLRSLATQQKQGFFLLFFFSILSVTGCQKNWWEIVKNSGLSVPGVSNADMVLEWNGAGAEAVGRLSTGPGGPIPPMIESRIYAILNVGLYDALNNIVVKNAPYALKIGAHPKANPDAAVAQAGHDIIVALMPPMSGYADSLLSVSLDGLAESDSKTQGIAIGRAAASAILDLRANDGSANAQIPYIAGTLPGQYRATPPFDGPPFNGFVAVPAWGNVKPFVMTSGSQFRAVPPNAVTSPEYAKDYNEMKSLGGTVSNRTKEQTEIGLFWLENIPHAFNRIARGLIVQENLDAWKAARCLALLQMAEADANIASLETKYYYNFWRPQTAIPLGNTDGNSGTQGDPSWVVLAPPTPPVPDYTSNHAANGGAASEVLREFFGKDNMAFSATSTSLPNVTREYASFSAAAKDNYLSRIYVGFHFRNAVLKGEDQGEKVGKWVMAHAGKPVN
jgi:PAP2 superfamily